MNALTTSLFLLPLLGPLSAQDPAKAQALDEYIVAAMTQRRIPGLALAVVQHGEIVHSKGYGQATLEHESPVGPTTVFEIASLTKHMTAALILRLVERDALGLDDSLGQHAPDCPTAWREITIRQCLTHTSGLPNQFLRRMDGKIALRNYPTHLVLEDAAHLPLDFEPGTGTTYSDLGYLMLGVVIERVTRKSWSACMHNELFGPLDMQRTTIRDLDAILVGRAANYRIEAGVLKNNRRDYEIELPSFVGVMSTVHDLALFDSALTKGLILTEPSRRLLWTPARRADGEKVVLWDQPYGFGWSLGTYRGRTIAEHDGWTGSSTLRFLDDDLTVIVLTNLVKGSNSEPWRITRGVARFFLAHLVADPVATSASELMRLVGVYEHPDGVRQTVALENGALVLQSLWHAEGSHPWILRPSAPLRFEAIDDEATVIFEDEDGSASGLELQVDGERRHARRVETR